MIEGHSVKPLAARQRDVLVLIARFREATGEPPTVEYLARRLGIAPNTVREHLAALHRKGWLTSPSPGGLRCPHVPPSETD